MATWAELKDLRLLICDPAGVINLETVADDGSLPVSSIPQTAYQIELDGSYRIQDPDTGSWERPDIELSDSRLYALIDVMGVLRAAPKAVRLISATLGQKLFVARQQSGSESTDFMNLTTAYNFYKALADSMDEDAAQSEGVSTGKYIRTVRPSIGGGM